MKNETFYIENQYGENYHPIEGKWMGPNWMPELDSRDYLESLMNIYPEKFKGCKIVDTSI